MFTEKKYKVMDYMFLQLVFFIYSISGIVSKKASQYNLLSKNFIEFYLIELFIIFIYAYLWQKVIKKFSIVTAYSSKGIVVIWMLIWSVLFFNETIKFNNIIGALIIIAGIGMVSLND